MSASSTADREKGLKQNDCKSRRQLVPSMSQIFSLVDWHWQGGVREEGSKCGNYMKTWNTLDGRTEGMRG